MFFRRIIYIVLLFASALPAAAHNLYNEPHEHEEWNPDYVPSSVYTMLSFDTDEALSYFIDADLTTKWMFRLGMSVAVSKSESNGVYFDTQTFGLRFTTDPIRNFQFVGSYERYGQNEEFNTAALTLTVLYYWKNFAFTVAGTYRRLSINPATLDEIEEDYTAYSNDASFAMDYSLDNGITVGGISTTSSIRSLPTSLIRPCQISPLMMRRFHWRKG